LRSKDPSIDCDESCRKSSSFLLQDGPAERESVKGEKQRKRIPPEI
jgi:hypothetical protein